MCCCMLVCSVDPLPHHHPCTSRAMSVVTHAVTKPNQGSSLTSATCCATIIHTLVLCAALMKRSKSIFAHTCSCAAGDGRPPGCPGPHRHPEGALARQDPGAGRRLREGRPPHAWCAVDVASTCASTFLLQSMCCSFTQNVLYCLAEPICTILSTNGGCVWDGASALSHQHLPMPGVRERIIHSILRPFAQASRARTCRT